MIDYAIDPFPWPQRRRRTGATAAGGINRRDRFAPTVGTTTLNLSFPITRIGNELVFRYNGGPDDPNNYTVSNSASTGLGVITLTNATVANEVILVSYE